MGERDRRAVALHGADGALRRVFRTGEERAVRVVAVGNRERRRHDDPDSNAPVPFRRKRVVTLFV